MNSSQTVSVDLVKSGRSADRLDARPVSVSIEHLSKTYPVPFARLKAFLRRKTKGPVDALRDVSFNVRQGEVFGLIGRNGAGKTTLTKIIATLVQPTSGVATVNGYDSVNDDERVRSQIGLAGAEERSFYWRLTGEQNLMFFARLYGLSDRNARARIAELLKLFELEETARRRFGELSTGNKQRLAVARAMLSSPPILLLDEPTRSLDPLAASSMRQLIASLARTEPPVTILFTSHNLAEVETLCDRVAIISKGEIKAIDTPSKLRSLTTNVEHVRVTVGGLSIEEASAAVKNAVSLFRCSGEPPLVSFDREVGDDKLDAVIRILQNAGGKIVAVDTERPTLLDVLESYET